MPEAISQESLEQSLESTFALPDKPAATPVDPLPDDPEALVEAAEAPVEGDEAPPEEGEAQKAAPPEIEIEIEVDGVREIVRGADAIKELAQKGKYFSKATEENARVRDALIAQAQMQQQHALFQQSVMGDITELRAFDTQLQQYDQIDWAAAFDSDPFNALKLKEQRDQLREKRNAKLNELNAKQHQYQQGQAQAARQLMDAETAALVAKLPEWRNSEKAAAEKQAIARELLETYGFNQAEVGALMDHRMVMVARDAAAYRALQKGKAEHVKQVRAAPPVVKPGAAPKAEQGKAEFNKQRQELRKLGRERNHHAQEALVTKMLNRAFK